MSMYGLGCLHMHVLYVSVNGFLGAKKRLRATRTGLLLEQQPLLTAEPSL